MIGAGVRAAVALVAILAVAACAGPVADSADPLAGGVEPGAGAANAAEAPGPDLAAGLPVPPGLEADAQSDAEPAPEAPAGEAVVGSAGGVAAAEAPHVYMAIQPDSGGMTSVVFAIDASRDNTPSDEPAIRITPEATEAQSGRCNPQQLRYYNFPPESADAPVYGPDEASRGVGPKDLPGFMATAVSSEMIDRGIAEDLEETRPQNVCTRKLFEQTIIAATTGQG